MAINCCSSICLPFPATCSTCKKSLGVQGLIPAETSANGGGVLNRKITERLMSLKDLATRQVERADRMERARRATQVSGAFAALKGRSRLQVLCCEYVVVSMEGKRSKYSGRNVVTKRFTQ